MIPCAAQTASNYSTVPQHVAEPTIVPIVSVLLPSMLERCISIVKYVDSGSSTVAEDVNIIRLNESYRFYDVWTDPKDLALYIDNPTCLVFNVELSSLVYWYRFFSLDELKLLCKAHGVKHRNRTKPVIGKELRDHVCIPRCARLVYIFKSLSRQRRHVSKFFEEGDKRFQFSYIPPAPKEIRSPETLDQVTIVPQQPEPQVSDAKTYAEGKENQHTGYDHLKPPDKEKKEKMIREWQEEMSAYNQSMVVCAACSIQTTIKASVYIPASDTGLILLRNDFLPDRVLPTSYNFTLYNRAILHPRGLEHTDSLGRVRLCLPCHKSLSSSKTPKYALSNWLYYGRDEMPVDVLDAFNKASLFDKMLICRARANSITCRFNTWNKDDNDPKNESILDRARKGIRGNVLVAPLDVIRMNKVIPPCSQSIQDTMCAVFIGKTIPTRSTIERYRPVLVRKSRVKLMIEFLLKYNSHYHPSDEFQYSEKNLNSLTNEDANETEEKLPNGVHIGYMPSNDAVESTVADYTTRYDSEGSGSGKEDYHELLMENVGYTEGDDSPVAYLAMKALALERCLQGKPFVASGTGSNSIPDFKNPSILTWLFPHLDPWGIGGFFHPGRTVKISMFDQLCHLLKVYKSPFQRDPEFAFVFHNVCRKALVSQNLRFAVPRNTYRKVADDLLNIDPDVLAHLSEECKKDPYYNAKDEKEKHVFKILSGIRTVSKHLPGSDGYKIMMRNEIRALINYKGTPTLFITINPSDVDHPIVRLIAGDEMDLDDVGRGEELSKWQRSLFAAKNPSACAQFFDATITQFIRTILRYGREDDGLYGRCSGYYGTVEAQGKGTLHCHMLVWLQGHLSPHNLKAAMLDSEAYRNRVLSWMEAVISCEFPGSSGVEQQLQDFPRRIMCKETGDPHPGVAPPPSIKECQSITAFWKDFDQFLGRLLHQFAWHEHQTTCWKYLDRGQAKSDENCRMGMDGTTREKSEFDVATNEILLRRHHPRIAPYTDVVSFLLQCNMDIKFVGSGEAAKAFLYYVTDYITKASLTVHVGMAALSYAVKRIYTRIPGGTSNLSDEEAKGAVITAVNSMMGRQEISHPQVMSYLTGGGDHYKSHRFVILQWSSFRNQGGGSIHERKLYEGVAKGASQIGANDKRTEQTDSNASVSLALGSNSITASSQYFDYIYRSKDSKFDTLCLYDFVSWTSKHSFNGLNTRTNTESIGAFTDDTHPQHSTHYLRIRRRPYVPVILGPSIPNPDRSEAVKEDWARDMLLLFKPWRDIKTLKEENETWTYAFTSYEPYLSPFHCKVIANMKALVECSEARDRHRLRTRAKNATDETVEDHSIPTSQVEREFGILIDPEEYDNMDPFSVLEGPGDMSTTPPGTGDVLDIASSRLLDMCLPLKMEEIARPPDPNSLVPSRVNDHDLPILSQHLAIMQLKRKRQDPETQKNIPDDDAHAKKIQRGDAPISEQATLQDDENHQDRLIRYRYSIAENVIDEMGIRNNDRQLKAFNIIARQLIEIEGPEHQLLMHVAGVGGTGKSHIINAIVTLFERLDKSHELVLGAPTGIAAVLINGQTLHSLINLSLNEKRTNVTQLISIWKHVKFLIIDEVSMIGARFMSQLSSRMRQGKGDNTNDSGKPFGGVNVIFMGDFGQLKPPRQYALFANELIKSPGFAESRNNQGISALNGVFLWRQVRCIVELTKNQRHSADPEYAAFLDRLRVGRCTVHNEKGPSDIEYLRTRLIENQISDLRTTERFRDAPIIVGSKSLRDLLNVKLVRYHAKRAGVDPMLYFSRDFVNRKNVTGQVQNKLWNIPSSTNREAFGRLPLFIGMKVMVTENLAFGNGVVNGSEGYVTDIKYEEDHAARRYAKVVYVHILGCGVNIEGIGPDIVPIFPVVTRIEHGIPALRSKIKAFSRRQVPLVPAYVYTDYKSQGRTLYQVIVDLCTARGQGVYVMLSRVKSLSGLLILRWFPPNKIYHRLSEELRTELSRIQEIASNTPEAPSSRGSTTTAVP